MDPFRDSTIFWPTRYGAIVGGFTCYNSRARISQCRDTIGSSHARTGSTTKQKIRSTGIEYQSGKRTRTHLSRQFQTPSKYLATTRTVAKRIPIQPGKSFGGWETFLRLLRIHRLFESLALRRSFDAPRVVKSRCWEEHSQGTVNAECSQRLYPTKSRSRTFTWKAVSQSVTVTENSPPIIHVIGGE